MLNDMLVVLPIIIIIAGLLLSTFATAVFKEKSSRVATVAIGCLFAILFSLLLMNYCSTGIGRNASVISNGTTLKVECGNTRTGYIVKCNDGKYILVKCTYTLEPGEFYKVEGDSLLDLR